MGTHIFENIWFNTEGKNIKDIKNALQEQIAKNRLTGYKQLLCIGTDSQVQESENIITVVTAIVILREGNGGNCFYHKTKIKKKMHIKERMLYETTQTVMVAYNLRDSIVSDDIDIELHADINTNPHFKSNRALKEAMGYIIGMGFEFKAKPDAFAASYVANKFTKN